MPPAVRSKVMGSKYERWCKFHKVKGHHTDNCYQGNRKADTKGPPKYVRGGPFNQAQQCNLHEREDTRILGSRKVKEAPRDYNKQAVCHNLNTIVGGFIGDDKTSFSHKRYTRQVLSMENLTEMTSTKTLEPLILFSEEDAFGFHPLHD